MSVKRDQWDQLADPWTARDFKLLWILEEIVSYRDEERTLSAYMADILDIMEEEE